MGNVALRLQLREELTTKKLLWDGENLRFTNSDKANEFLKTEFIGKAGRCEVEVIEA